MVLPVPGHRKEEKKSRKSTYRTIHTGSRNHHHHLHHHLHLHHHHQHRQSQLLSPRVTSSTSAYYIQANTGTQRVHKATPTQTFFYVCTRGCAWTRRGEERGIYTQGWFTNQLVGVVRFRGCCWFGSLHSCTTTTPFPLHHRHNPAPAGAELDRLRGRVACGAINTTAGCRACRGCYVVVARAYAAIPRVGQGATMEARERDGTLSGQRLEEKEGGSDECGTVDSRLKYSARF